MNNLNIFLLFSSLIYFKLAEDKKGNLKIVVGFLSLYLFYRVLTNVEEGLEEDDCILGSIYVPASSPERAKCILGEIDCDADPNYNPDCLQLLEICQKDGDCRDNKKCYEGKCVECLDERSLTGIGDGPRKDNFRCNETGDTCVYDGGLGETKCVHQRIGMTCSTHADCPDPPNNSCPESQDESQDERKCICKPSLNFCGYFKSIPDKLTDECKQICDTDNCCEFDMWALIGMIVLCSIFIFIVAFMVYKFVVKVRFWKGAYDMANADESGAQLIERVFSGDYRDPAYEFLEVPECKIDLSGGDTPKNVSKIMKCKKKLEAMRDNGPKKTGWEGSDEVWAMGAELEKINWALKELGKLPTPTAPPKAAARAIGESYKLTQAAEEHGLVYKPQRLRVRKYLWAILPFLFALIGVVIWVSKGAPGSALIHF